MPLITIFLDKDVNDELEKIKCSSGISKKRIIELATIDLCISLIKNRLAEKEGTINRLKKHKLEGR